jgi:hypothetical protein
VDIPGIFSTAQTICGGSTYANNFPGTPGNTLGCVPTDMATGHVNIIWSPVPATNIGLEYEVAYADWRNVLQTRGFNLKNDGLGERVQATMQFGF